MTDEPEPITAPRWVDLSLALIMALAAVCTAWAGFQSAKWSGVQANSYASAGATRTESNRESTVAGQERILDVVSFTTWLTALEQEIIAGESPRPAGSYTPRPDAMSGFLFERFREEFRPAVDAWLDTRPLVNADAPPTPFAMPEYRLESAERAAELERAADELAETARTANQRSDNYVLTAVLLALVLFFSGVAGRARSRRATLLLFTLAGLALLAGVVLLIAMPVTI